jgi:pimeloyl-ACP methyl ester carboxylesterase
VKAVALGVAMLAGCAASSPNRADYATIGPLRMYYEVHGQGRPLVLLHGGGSTIATSFGAILPRLALRHRVIAPEQQGHGHTADIDRPLSFEQMADDTAALLEQLGVGEADVLGFSNGGVIAMQLAIRHPRLVRRLVLASTYFERSAFPPEFWKGFEHASPENMPAPLRDAYRSVAPHPEALAVMVAKTVAMMLAFQDWPEATLRSIRAPALVMVGDADVIAPEHAVRMTRLLPHAQLAVFPGSGHGTYLGAAEAAKPGSVLPELATAMIEEFLADTDPTSYTTAPILRRCPSPAPPYRDADRHSMARSAYLGASTISSASSTSRRTPHRCPSSPRPSCRPRIRPHRPDLDHHQTT